MKSKHTISLLPVVVRRISSVQIKDKKISLDSDVFLFVILAVHLFVSEISQRHTKRFT